MPKTSYEKLLQLGKKIQNIHSALLVLQWDQEIFMPPGSIQARVMQLETMIGLYHRMRTSKRFAHTLQQLIDVPSGKILDKTLDDSRKAALREWRRDYLLAKKLPTHFVKAFETLTSQSLPVWAEARKENAFIKFAPFLEKIVEFCRRKADYYGYDEHPYDALLDEYEPGCKKKDIDILFGKLKISIQQILKKIQQKPQIDDSFLNRSYDKQKIFTLSKKLLGAMGYDLQQGRLDESSHPFSTSFHPTDSRITTRWHDHFLKSNIGVILHEGGHGLYEMGLPVKDFGSPLCQAVSQGIHESQSRFWETFVGEGLPFWTYFLPQLKAAATPLLDDIDLDTFYRGYNRVSPDLIRVDADEVTYSLHVILRFELEVALIEGKLSIRELPEAWNAKMQEYLGVTPQTDREGCLQDIHWSLGTIGYFPTYTLGNLYAAQFFETFQKEHPDWQTKIAEGNLLFVREWLKQNIHCHGRRYGPKELVEKVTHQPPSYLPYINYLETKYKALYKF